MSEATRARAPALATAAAATPLKRAHRARMRRFIEELAQRHFGGKAKRLVERGGGLTNTVYEFAVGGGEYIVRTNENATKINDYLKEQWAMEAARAEGVPVPRVLEVGNVADGRPYMIAERLIGIDGRQAPQRVQLAEALGQAAARLHRVRTRGFGPVFDWSSNRLSRHACWAAWLGEGFGIERRLVVLRRHHLLDSPQALRVRRSAATMARWRKPAALQHGDLRLKNAIVDPATNRLLGIIDWETCISLPAPYWDLSLALHDLGIDEQEAFLSGYGIKPSAYRAALPFVRVFNVLNYAHAVESAAARKDQAGLERFRARFRRELDLYDV